MQKKYLTYSVEEILEDKPFVAWVLNDSRNEAWENFIENHGEFGQKVTKAREIIRLLRDTYDVLDEDSVIKMWQSIDDFDKLSRIRARRVVIRRSLSWAASIFLIFSLGVLGYFFLNNEKSKYNFSDIPINNDTNTARLVTSGGEEIILTEKSSTISLNDEYKLSINNDTIIDLSREVTSKKLEMNEVVVPYGKKSELLLADGTKVWLNAGSRLAFPSKFTGKTREVFLEGEAYFEVFEDSSRPFMVNADEVNVKVLGTRFNISAYPTNKYVETTLLEGSVAMSNPKTFGPGNKETLLIPNQRASFNKSDNSVNVADELDAEIHIAWINGWLQFSRESLNSVFAKMERYYNVEINTEKNFPSLELISGKLDLKESLEDVFMALTLVAPVEYQINGNTIYVEKKGTDK